VACIGVAFDFSAWGSGYAAEAEEPLRCAAAWPSLLVKVPTPQICLGLQSSQDCMKISSLPMDNADITPFDRALKMHIWKVPIGGSHILDSPWSRLRQIGAENCS
jgi:hypothetical protein